jgi:hypothetical protein
MSSWRSWRSSGTLAQTWLWSRSAVHAQRLQLMPEHLQTSMTLALCRVYASQAAPLPAQEARGSNMREQLSAAALEDELHDHRKFFALLSLFRRRGHLIADLDPLRRGSRGPWKSPAPPASFQNAYARGRWAMSRCTVTAACCTLLTPCASVLDTLTAECSCCISLISDVGLTRHRC